jgi:hypothetical protein
MSDSTRVMGRRPRASPSAARTATAVIATIVLVLLAAACGGGPSSTGSGGSRAGGSAGSPSAIAYSACMRSRGVPNYPDPDSGGQLPKGDAQQFGVSTSRYQAAQQACQRLIPTCGSLHQQEYQCMQKSNCPSALVQQMLTADRKLARCMRSHGVPNFPDPTTDSNGPVFNITNAGISDAASHTSEFEAKLTECARLVGGNAPESFE